MAKKGAMRRDPKYTTQPVRDGNGRTAGDSDVFGDTKGARRAAERLARKTPTERLSPGVYRSASGDLVGQGGRPIQRQPQAPMAQQVAGGMQPQPQQVGQPVTDQTNKPFDLSQYNPEQIQAQDMARQLAIQQGVQPGQIQSGIYWNPNFNPNIGKTPPNWSGGPVSDMMFRQPMPQGMPQMPQPSANQGGQYRLSPGMYGSREQAMQQYNQQMQPYMMQGVPQQRKG